MGCMAATFYYQLKNSETVYKRYLKYTDLLSFTGFAFLAGSLVSERKLAIILSVIGAFFLVISAENSRGKWLLKTKIMNYLGLMSFSLYLWHWPVLSFYHMYKVNISPFEIGLLIVLIFILSFLSYHFVEKPLKDQSWDLLKSDGRYNFKNLIPISGCLFVSLFFFNTKFKKPPDLQLSELVYVEDDMLEINSNCTLTDIGDEDNLQKWCYSQNISKPEAGLLIGGSQAHVLYRAFVTESQSLSWHLVASESCSPYPIPTMYELCKKIINESYANLEKHPEIRHVLFLMANHIYIENREAFRNPEVKENIKKSLLKLNDMNRKVYLVRPTPEFPRNISSCSRQRFAFYKVFDNSEYCKIDKLKWDEQSAEYNLFLDSLKEEVPSVSILDVDDITCDKAACYVTRDGKAIYQDQSHLSYEGNSQLAKRALKMIESP